MPALISRRKTIGGRDGFVDESPASSIQETNDNSMWKVYKKYQCYHILTHRNEYIKQIYFYLTPKYF